MPTPRRRIPRRLIVLIGAVALVAVGILVAFQPRVANGFSYALPGRDGLPTYIYAHGRRYHSEQVCAGDDWCAQDRLQQLIPRCITQAELQAGPAPDWPLRQFSTMLTLFGAPQPIFLPASDTGSGVMHTYIMADGPDCYVAYGLEGGP